MKNTSRFLVVFFMIAMLVPIPLAALFPDFAGSSTENRALAGMPALSETGFTGWPSAFEQFFTDHLPLKGIATELHAKLMFSLFNESGNEHVVLGKDGWYLYHGYNNDDPLADLCGVSPLSQEQMDSILKRIKGFQERHPNYPFVLFIAPNKETVYRDYFSENFQKSFQPQTRVERMAAVLKDKTDAFCFPVEELRAMKSDYQLYYKYDTHWNRIGAYLGLCAVCDKLGVPLPVLSELTVQVAAQTAPRDLAYISNTMEFCTDDVFYDVFPYPGVTVEGGEKETLYEKSMAYTRFFRSDAPNEQTILLIGDSFSEVMIDLVTRSFQNVLYIRRDNGKAAEIHALTEELMEQNPGCLVVMEMVERGAGWLTRYEYLF